MPRIAVSQPHGSNPSQRSDTGPVCRTAGGRTSSTIGPLRDERIVFFTGSLPAHLDRLRAKLRRLPFAVVEEAARMRRVGLLLIEVALRADVVGDAPGDVLVAADHDARHAGQRDAGDVEAAAVQAHLVPDRDGVIRDVRIAGDERLAGVGAIAGEHPVVAAWPGVAAG